MLNYQRVQSMVPWKMFPEIHWILHSACLDLRKKEWRNELKNTGKDSHDAWWNMELLSNLEMVYDSAAILHLTKHHQHILNTRKHIIKKAPFSNKWHKYSQAIRKKKVWTWAIPSFATLNIPVDTLQACRFFLQAKSTIGGLEKSSGYPLVMSE